MSAANSKRSPCGNHRLRYDCRFWRQQTVFGLARRDGERAVGIRQSAETNSDELVFLQGYLPVVFLVNYLKYGIIPSQETVFTGPNFVTPDTAAKAMEFTKKGIR